MAAPDAIEVSSGLTYLDTSILEPNGRAVLAKKLTLTIEAEQWTTVEITHDVGTTTRYEATYLHLNGHFARVPDDPPE